MPSPQHRVVVFKFDEKQASLIDLPYSHLIHERLIELFPHRIYPLFSRFPGIRFRPAFTESSPDRLRQLHSRAKEKAASRAAETRLPNLLTYYEATVPVGLNAHELASQLRSWPEIEGAYVVQPPIDPGTGIRPPGYDCGAILASPQFDKEVHNQTYLCGGQIGVNAVAVWGRVGGAGQGMSFVDIEQGINKNHLDLKGHNITINGLNQNYFAHGTRVLGVVAGTKNNSRAGIQGIAWGTDTVHFVSEFRPSGEYLTHQAIEFAVAVIEPKILLLEVQALMDDGQGGFVTDAAGDYVRLPAETADASYAMIANATASGIVVVEAAANSGVNLDDRPWGPLFDRNLRDSGAVIVGGVRSAIPHARHPEANDGTRVDCYAWAEDVFTSTAADATSQGRGHTHFGGTSGAAAIVAGVALAVQGMHSAANAGLLLRPEELRHLVSHHGTPCQGVLSDQNAGNGLMPDLDQIASVLSVV